MNGSCVIQFLGHNQILSVKVFTMIGAIHYFKLDVGVVVVGQKKSPHFCKGFFFKGFDYFGFQRKGVFTPLFGTLSHLLLSF
jgi:hypothetical protein